MGIQQADEVYMQKYNVNLKVHVKYRPCLQWRKYK